MFEEIRKKALKEQLPQLERIGRLMGKNGKIDEENLHEICTHLYSLVANGPETPEDKVGGQVGLAREAMAEITKVHLSTLFGKGFVDALYGKDHSKLLELEGKINALDKIRQIQYEREALFHRKLVKALYALPEEKALIVQHHWSNVENAVTGSFSNTRVRLRNLT